MEKFEREKLIVDCLSRGLSVGEVAANVGVGEKRMRAIIREILARRMPALPEAFAAIQVGRLNDALLFAYGAMAKNNFRGAELLVKIVRELDRYHGFVPARRRPSRREAAADEVLPFGAAFLSSLAKSLRPGSSRGTAEIPKGCGALLCSQSDCTTVRTKAQAFYPCSPHSVQSSGLPPSLRGEEGTRRPSLPPASKRPCRARSRPARRLHSPGKSGGKP